MIFIHSILYTNNTACFPSFQVTRNKSLAPHFVFVFVFFLGRTDFEPTAVRHFGEFFLNSDGWSLPNEGGISRRF